VVAVRANIKALKPRKEESNLLARKYHQALLKK
jgi:hypothetical protein